LHKTSNYRSSNIEWAADISAGVTYTGSGDGVRGEEMIDRD